MGSSDKSIKSFDATSHTLSQIRASLPLGTKIYQANTLVISNGSHSASFPGEATYRRDASGLVVTYNGRSHTFPASSQASLQGAAEYYARGNERAVLCTCNQLAVDGSGTSSSTGLPHGYMWVPDRTQGVVTGLSGNPTDGFTLTFSNPFNSTANDNYSFEMYDSNGKPLGIINVQSQVFGSSGEAAFSIPSQFQGSMASIMVSMTVTTLDGGMAAPGNAHAHAP